MHKVNSGLTLVELLITVAVVSVLVALAAPSYRTFMVKQSVNATAMALVSDMRLARSEAVRRSRRVAICASTDQATCASGANALWRNGWIVYVPSNANGSFTAGDEVVKVQAQNVTVDTIAPASGATLTSFVYEATGWAKAATQTFILTPVSPVPSGSIRVVCVSMQGRVALRAEGATACS